MGPGVGEEGAGTQHAERGEGGELGDSLWAAIQKRLDSGIGGKALQGLLRRI